MKEGRRALNRQRTVQDIERVFLSIYRQWGIDRVNISEICKQCGISRSTFYLYFDDKYAVLQGVEDRLLAQLKTICFNNLPDLLDSRSGSETALRTIAHLRSNLDWYQALLSIHGDPMFAYRWKRDIEHSLRFKLLGRGMAEQDAIIHGVLFASALLGLYTHVVMELPDIPDRELCRYMDDLLLRSLV